MPLITRISTILLLLCSVAYSQDTTQQSLSSAKADALLQRINVLRNDVTFIVNKSIELDSKSPLKRITPDIIYKTRIEVRHLNPFILAQVIEDPKNPGKELIIFNSNFDYSRHLLDLVLTHEFLHIANICGPDWPPSHVPVCDWHKGNKDWKKVYDSIEISDELMRHIRPILKEIPEDNPKGKSWRSVSGFIICSHEFK